MSELPEPEKPAGDLTGRAASELLRRLFAAAKDENFEVDDDDFDHEFDDDFEDEDDEDGWEADSDDEEGVEQDFAAADGSDDDFDDD